MGVIRQSFSLLFFFFPSFSLTVSFGEGAFKSPLFIHIATMSMAHDIVVTMGIIQVIMLVVMGMIMRV
jgi:hypothetical protein